MTTNRTRELVILMKNYPRISRKFDASYSLSLPDSLIILILLVLMISSYIYSLVKEPSSPLSSIFMSLQRQPFDLEKHLELAHIYYDLGDTSQARKELALIGEIENNHILPRVLGVRSDITNLIARIETEPRQKTQEREFWQKVVTDHPDYRDAWVQLLYLAYNASDITQAKEYLDKIQSLDPNFINELPDYLQSL